MTGKPRAARVEVELGLPHAILADLTFSLSRIDRKRPVLETFSMEDIALPPWMHRRMLDRHLQEMRDVGSTNRTSGKKPETGAPTASILHAGDGAACVHKSTAWLRLGTRQ